ncbi:unnamed protein product [Arabidopsis thaliana]|uniref:Uncharacterized protein n=1 Tax=Arabidopsis thaliana TaxID=3702 RepID=A0A654FTD7_ARATH|nr:unnamed protein product [Arabidopsis thaliana]
MYGCMNMIVFSLPKYRLTMGDDKGKGVWKTEPWLQARLMLRPTTSPHGIHCECVSAAGAQCSAAQCPCLILQRATAVTVTRPWPLNGFNIRFSVHLSAQSSTHNLSVTKLLAAGHFFCVNPPKAGDFPAMAETSYSWRKKEHWYLRLSTDVVYVVRHSVLGHSTSPKPQGDWGLLRYSHLGTDLFCLTLNASRPSCQRLSEANEEGSGSAANEEGSGSAANEEGSGSAANEEGSGLQNEFDTLIRALLKIGQRKRKGRIAVTHGKQWGGSYEEILNSRESKAGFRELVNKLGADALTEDLELELRYEIEGLTENAIAWFNQNDNAAFDDWKAKLIEFQTALSKLKEK